jgi:Ca-activated chloride channel family protein
MKTVARICSLIILIALCGVVHAQEVGPDEVVKINTALVSIPVVVNDRQGRYISGLKAEDFTVFDDGNKQSISFFAAEEEPLTVAILLDTSKSTRSVLGKIKDAAKDFIKLLQPNDRCMIVSFDYAVHQLSPLTNDRKVLEKAIKQAEIGEFFGTVLRDAVFGVVEKSLSGIKGRKAAIVLTDGKDFGSYQTRNELLHTLEESDSMVYTVFYKTVLPFRGFRRGGMGGGFPPRGPMARGRGRGDMDDADAIEFLALVSETTAGRSYNRDVTDLKKTFQLIADELRQQYRLGYYPPTQTTFDGALHRIKVKVADQDMIVRSRATYRSKQHSGQ